MYCCPTVVQTGLGSYGTMDRNPVYNANDITFGASVSQGKPLGEEEVRKCNKLQAYRIAVVPRTSLSLQTTTPMS